MPTGSTDADVLTDWILHSLGLIRRRDENGGLQRIMRHALLADPLKGWNSSERNRIIAALEVNDWKRQDTAQHLGISRASGGAA